MNLIKIVKIFLFCGPFYVVSLNIEFMKDLLRVMNSLHHLVYFGCSIRNSVNVARLVQSHQKYFNYVQLKENTSLKLERILGYKFNPPTIILLDFACPFAVNILEKATEFKSYNKTYEWILIDENSIGALNVLNESMAVGLNSQILYVNKTELETHELYDIYSHGRHLGSPMITQFFANWTYKERLKTVTSLYKMRGFNYRGQFNQLKLRGVLVIDRDNITTNQQVSEILEAENYEAAGLIHMIKYCSELVRVLSDCLNFTIDYRITRGWAGRLTNTSYRLGLMGVVKRGEVDIAASPSFLRISRLNDLDFYHQSWNFESGFIYLYSNFVKHNSGGGDFLVPFDDKVWIISLVFLVIIAIIWKYFELASKKFLNCETMVEDTNESILLHSVAAVCQQGLEPTPKTTTTRIIAISLILFALLLYNFYTSSVVGGLLSNNDPGIQNLDELVESRLTLFYDDIGFNKVVMTEQTNRSITMKVRKKFYSQPNVSPVGFTNRSNAIPYIRAGTHAYHCEFCQTYGEIAKKFDASEICNLRTVTGLLKHETLAMVLTKKSQYREMFKQILDRATEIGVIKREQIRLRDPKPVCQGSLTVLPVALPSVLNAFFLLAGGMIISLTILSIEVLWVKYKFPWSRK